MRLQRYNTEASLRRISFCLN